MGVVFPILMAFFMTLVMSFTMTAIRGFVPTFFLDWAKGFGIGFLVGTPTSLVVSPLLRKLLSRFTVEEDKK